MALFCSKIETMKKNVCFCTIMIGLVFTSRAFSQSPLPKKNDMTTENHYPRIEFYTDKDYTDHSNWTDKYEGADGKVYYMGARDYKPFIDRKTYLLNEQQAAKLMKSELVFLPYFGEIKENITFEQYLKTSLLQNSPQRTNLFPRALDKYLSYPKEDRLYYNTIVEYEKNHPSNVVVVWLNKDTWYVDDVFYRMEIDEILKEAKAVEEQQLIKGDIKNFMDHSFLIQPKLTEGITSLQTNKDKKWFKNDEVVLEIALTPGEPGSKSYSYKFYADGKISDGGSNYSTYSYLTNHLQWIGIQNELREINLKNLSGNMLPTQFVHDGQSYIVGAFQTDRYYRLVYGHGNPMPESVHKFMNYVLKVASESQKK